MLILYYPLLSVIIRYYPLLSACHLSPGVHLRGREVQVEAIVEGRGVGQLKIVTLRATVRDGVEVGVKVELEVMLEAYGPSRAM